MLPCRLHRHLGVCDGSIEVLQGWRAQNGWADPRSAICRCGGGVCRDSWTIQPAAVVLPLMHGRWHCSQTLSTPLTPSLQAPRRWDKSGVGTANFDGLEEGNLPLLAGP